MEHADLQTLKFLFDRVCLWYARDEDGNLTGDTIAVIHEGSKRYIGISKLHHRDRFNRKKGRAMALNRALYAKDVSIGGRPSREAHKKNLLSFSYDVEDRTNFDEPFTFWASASVGILVPAWMMRYRSHKAEAVEEDSCSE